MTGPGPSARRALEERLARGGRGLVPFLTAGFPDWERMEAAVQVLAEAGADALELGVPFSDPLADGPTIQASSQRALAQGVTLRSILEKVEARGSLWGLPVVLMSYANPILACGVETFAKRARAAGVAGVLVSDLPPEELPDLWTTFREVGLETAVLVAPTTRPERIPVLARAATGYIYCVTRTGVTGKGGKFAHNLPEQVAHVRRETDAPIVAGFGIRTPEDARSLGREVDGVVVGARLIEILSSEDAEGARKELRALATGLRKVLDQA